MPPGGLEQVLRQGDVGRWGGDMGASLWFWCVVFGGFAPKLFTGRRKPATFWTIGGNPQVTLGSHLSTPESLTGLLPEFGWYETMSWWRFSVHLPPWKWLWRIKSWRARKCCQTHSWFGGRGTQGEGRGKERGEEKERKKMLLKSRKRKGKKNTSTLFKLSLKLVGKAIPFQLFSWIDHARLQHAFYNWVLKACTEKVEVFVLVLYFRLPLIGRNCSFIQVTSQEQIFQSLLWNAWKRWGF